MRTHCSTLTLSAAILLAAFGLCSLAQAQQTVSYALLPPDAMRSHSHGEPTHAVAPGSIGSTSILGSRKYCLAGCERCLQRRRFCRDQRQPSQRWPGIESCNPHVQRQHDSSDFKFCRRKRWRGRTQLLLPQDRTPQTRARRLHGKYRQLRSRSGVWLEPSVVSSP